MNKHSNARMIPLFGGTYFQVSYNNKFSFLIDPNGNFLRYKSIKNYEELKKHFYDRWVPSKLRSKIGVIVEKIKHCLDNNFDVQEYFFNGIERRFPRKLLLIGDIHYASDTNKNILEKIIKPVLLDSKKE